ncbi:MAG: CBS domain-containing protein [Saprospiraceae bacterium]|jgi:CBS domain-containing protein|nr:CBS domain-containing protein [bacterium]MDG1434386.1 CBS domain-containing protein [Saprospiraceae bacterium]MDG2419731.1 CBS domain-containing protein [Saprospiraceae bacterium]
MNVLAPVSTIMTKDVISVAERDRLTRVRDIFKLNAIHHIPVTRSNKVVGIISREDLLLFMKGLGDNTLEKIINETRLNNYNAEVIMTRGVGKLEPTDRINVALDIFSKNLFRALPVVENDKLVGIVTTFDIIKTINEETSKVNL